MRRASAATVALLSMFAFTTSAQASTPSALLSITTVPDRFRPAVVFDYAAPVTVSNPATQVSLTKTGGATPVPAMVSGSGTSEITVSVDGTLASGASYTASLLPDGDATADQTTWQTRRAPAHQTLRAKIVTALPADAVTAIGHELDQLNLLAVPKPGDFVDISAATGRSLTSADLKGYQAAFVVTTQDVISSGTDASVLASYAANKHGVVLAGQTHWTSGGLWTAQSALGSPIGTWATNWSPLDYVDPPAIEGGTLKQSATIAHFITANLTALSINAPGSGAQTTHQGWNEQVIARLAPTASYPAGQSLVAVHSEASGQSGRIADLGFNPWSSAAAAGGGFDAGQAQAVPLIGRSLWWSMNRIAPHASRFTSKPANPSRFTTVLFNMTAKDADTGDGVLLRFQYKVNRGRWKWARGGGAFALYHLKPGRYYTVRARAVDSGGNKDPDPARYRFRTAANAYG